MRFKHSRTVAAPGAAAGDAWPRWTKTVTARPTACWRYEPPHRLAFTFGAETRPETASRSGIPLAPEGDPKDNKVRLTLTHSKIPDARLHAANVSGGWHSHLAILQDRAEGQTAARLLGHLAQV